MVFNTQPEPSLDCRPAQSEEPLPLNFTVRIFRGRAGLEELRPDWQSLLSRIAHRRHHHYLEWYLALAETFDFYKSGSLLCIGVFTSDRLVMVLPFQSVGIKRRKAVLRTLELLSDEAGRLTARDFLMEDTFKNTRLFEELVGFLTTVDHSWDIISLQGILSDSCAFNALQNASRLRMTQSPGGHWGKCEFISCGEEDAPFGRLSKSFKQNMRTSHNKIKNETLVFTQTSHPEELSAYFTEFLLVESSGWKGDQGSSVLKQPMQRHFCESLLRNFSAHQQCEIYLMKINGKSVAASFCITVNHILYLMRIGYDEGMHLISPGHLILEHVLKTRGVRGTLKSIAPFGAPTWFKSWRPKPILGLYDVLIFRSRSFRYACPWLEPVERAILNAQKRVSVLLTLLQQRLTGKASRANAYHFSLIRPEGTFLIEGDALTLPASKTQIKSFPVEIDPKIHSVGIHRTGWVVAQIALSTNSPEGKGFAIRGFIPPEEAFKDQRVVIHTNGVAGREIRLAQGEFTLRIHFTEPAPDVQLQFSVEAKSPAAKDNTVSCRLYSVQFYGKRFQLLRKVEK